MALNKTVKTYSSYNVHIVVDGIVLTGVADDSFVQISSRSEGIVSRTGCDGEVARAIDPNHQYQVRLVTLQTSDSNKRLQEYYMRDRRNGTGMFALEIKDTAGNLTFFAEKAWVNRQPDITRGKDTVNYEWTIDTCAISDEQIKL